MHILHVRMYVVYVHGTNVYRVFTCVRYMYMQMWVYTYKYVAGTYAYMSACTFIHTFTHTYMYT